MHSLTSLGCCSGLATDTIYFYKVGDPNFGFSQEFAFLTGPPVGTTSQIQVLINADPVWPLWRSDMLQRYYRRSASLCTLYVCPGQPTPFMVLQSPCS